MRVHPSAADHARPESSRGCTVGRSERSCSNRGLSSTGRTAAKCLTSAAANSTIAKVQAAFVIGPHGPMWIAHASSCDSMSAVALRLRRFHRHQQTSVAELSDKSRAWPVKRTTHEPLRLCIGNPLPFNVRHGACLQRALNKSWQRMPGFHIIIVNHNHMLCKKSNGSVDSKYCRG